MFQNYQLILVPFVTLARWDAKDRAVEKAAICAAMLKANKRVLVQFDSRHPLADVPAPLRQPSLILQVDRGYPFELDEFALTQNATFGKIHHRAKIPWESVYRLQPEGSTPTTWEVDVPPELHKAFGIHVVRN